MIFHENRLPADDVLKYHALFVIFKKRQNLKLSSAANYCWRFMILSFQLAGSLMIAGTFQMLVGLTGLIGLLLRFVGPITVVPPLTIIGLQVYKATTRFAKAQWGVAIL